MEIYDKLKKICKTDEYVNLKNLCSMHVGGLGRYVCYPNSIKQIKKLLKFLKRKNIQYYIIGNGTNIIFEDAGYMGVLVSLKQFNKVKVKHQDIICEAGALLFAVNFLCKNEGLSGLEWSYGIPASMGGAVCMNAGAYGKEMKDFVECVWLLKNGRVVKYSNKDMQFSYRHSVVQNSNLIILKVKLKLDIGDTALIDQIQKEIFAYRKCCQPYGTYNSGSMFKKTDGESAGKTIDKLGLKGVKIGDIEISNVHANFFVNGGNGTCEDVRKLLNLVKYTVFKKIGINLKEEVIFVRDKRE